MSTPTGTFYPIPAQQHCLPSANRACRILLSPTSALSKASGAPTIIASWSFTPLPADQQDNTKDTGSQMDCGPVSLFLRLLYRRIEFRVRRVFLDQDG